MNTLASPVFTPANTALIVIDMQGEFCVGGQDTYLGRVGLPVTNNRAPIQPLQVVLSELRQRAFPIVHTREGHLSDLSDCPELKTWRSKISGHEIGTIGRHPECVSRTLVRGQPSWDFVPEMRPAEGEDVVDGCGKGKFFATDLEALLRHRGVQQLVFGGVTTSCCVVTSMREADDLGFTTFVLSDCTGDLGALDYMDTLRMAGTSVLSSKSFLAAVDESRMQTAFQSLPPLREVCGFDVSESVWAATGGFQQEPLNAKLAREADAFIAKLQERAAAEGATCSEDGDLCIAACDGGRTHQWPHNPERFSPETTALLCIDPAVTEADDHSPDLWVHQLARLGAAAGAAGLQLVYVGDDASSSPLFVQRLQKLAHPHAPVVIQRPRGAGAFSGTTLEARLRELGVTNLLLAGGGAATAVNTSMRQACDRGFDTLVVADCIGCEDRADLFGLTASVMRKAVFSACAHSDAVVAWMKAQAGYTLRLARGGA